MKQQIQDIIPPDKRSIRNIPIPSHKESRTTPRKVQMKKKFAEKEEEIILQNERKEILDLAEEEKDFVSSRAPRTGGVSRLFLWGITIAVVLVLFFTITHLFTSASVSIVEKSRVVPLSGPMTFYLNPQGDSAGYSAITVTDSVSSVLPATGEKQVSSKSSGTINVYNNYNTSPQRLIAGTRFETPSGLIFKLAKEVIVPGMTKGKTKNVAGSVEASIIADKPGADYNIPLSDFTIPAFKGDPKYSGFYGRSKSVMSGGNVGTIATLDDTTLASAIADLKKKLGDSLHEKAVKQLPQSEKTFDGFEKITYTVADPVPQPDGQKSTALVKVDGTAKVFAIDTESFAKKLLISGNSYSTSTSGFSVDFSRLKIAFLNEATSTITASIDGNAKVIWDLDVDAFKNAIKGKAVSEVPSISSSFKEIETASVTIKPFSFWKPSLPNSADKILIILKN
jgi:hypothetical protein